MRTYDFSAIRIKIILIKYRFFRKVQITSNFSRNRLNHILQYFGRKFNYSGTAKFMEKNLS